MYCCELIMTIAFVRAEMHVRQQVGARGIVCDFALAVYINPGKSLCTPQHFAHAAHVTALAGGRPFDPAPAPRLTHRPQSVPRFIS